MPNGQPNQLANLRPFAPGNDAGRRSYHPERALRLARRATVPAIQTAIACMNDVEAPWNERLAACKMLLAEGLPRKRDAFEALFAAAASGEGFIEVRFVAPGEPREVLDAQRTSGHAATFSVQIDDC